jgi:hypothetical protein
MVDDDRGGGGGGDDDDDERWAIGRMLDRENQTNRRKPTSITNTSHACIHSHT